MRVAAFADPRDAITTLAARTGDTMAGLSRLLDRDPRYLGRFVRDGRPAQLTETEQTRLADYFGADARDFGATDASPSAKERALERDRSKAVSEPLYRSTGTCELSGSV